MPVTWAGVPVSALVAWGVVSVIASVAATPFLINKHPQPPPPARAPVWLWAMLSTVLAVGTAIDCMWAACAAAVFNGLLAGVLTVRLGCRTTDARQ